MKIDRHKQLSELGADLLATTLLDLAGTSDEIDRIVKRLLASPKEKAKSFKSRMSSLKRRQHFVTWRESGSYARDLESLLADLKAHTTDPRIGVESVIAFYESDANIFEQCDDSNGTVGNIFKFEAADLFVFFASRCEDKEWLAALVLRLNQQNDYGVRNVLFERMAEYLPEPFIRSVVTKLWEFSAKTKDRYDKYRWLSPLRSLAKQLKDPSLLEQTYQASGDGVSLAALFDIAQLHLDCGDAATALKCIKCIPQLQHVSYERNELLMKIHKALNNTEEMAKTAWRIFHDDRSKENFKSLLSIIGTDKRESIIAEEISTILTDTELEYSDAEFLIDVGRADHAEKYLLKRAKEIDGYLYSNLLPLAKSLEKHDRPLGASLIYRSLIEFILKQAKAKNYHHAVKYIKKLDALAPNIDNWHRLTPHASYKLELRQKHRLKTSLWSQYAD